MFDASMLKKDTAMCH